MVIYYRIKKFYFWRFIMKIAKHVVEFVGGFAIGALGMLALAGFQTLVNKAFDKEPDCIRNATGLENYGEEYYDET
jgi:hypothetical protein